MSTNRDLGWWWSPFRRELHTIVTDLPPQHCQDLLCKHLHISTIATGKLPEIAGHVSGDQGFSIRRGIPLPHGSRPLVQGRYYRSGKRTEINLVVWIGWHDAISIVLVLVGLMLLTGVLMVMIWQWSSSGDRLAEGAVMIGAVLLLPAVSIWWFTFRRRGFWDEADDLGERLMELFQARVIS